VGLLPGQSAVFVAIVATFADPASRAPVSARAHHAQSSPVVLPTLPKPQANHN